MLILLIIVTVLIFIVIVCLIFDDPDEHKKVIAILTLLIGFSGVNLYSILFNNNDETDTTSISETEQDTSEKLQSDTECFIIEEQDDNSEFYIQDFSDTLATTEVPTIEETISVVDPFIENDYEIEPNDEISTATNININHNIQGNLSSYEDKDYFKFHIDNNGKINVTFSHDKFYDSGIFWKLHLYDNNENITDFYFEVKGNVAMLNSNNYRLPSGDYYLLIQSNYHNDCNYIFNINYEEEKDIYEIEPNNDFIESTPINVNQYYTGNLQSSKDNDYYIFTIENKGSVNLSFNHDKFDDNSAFWKVFIMDFIDSKSTQLISSNGNTSSMVSDTIRLPAGTYYLKVEPYYYNNFDYSFCVNYSGEDELFENEPNNDYGEATSILINKEYVGNIQTNDDIDFFVFTVNDMTSINLTFSHALVDDSSKYWDIEILNENEKLRSEGCKGNEPQKTISIDEINPGTYYIKIISYYFNNDDYRVIVN